MMYTSNRIFKMYSKVWAKTPVCVSNVKPFESLPGNGVHVKRGIEKRTKNSFNDPKRFVLVCDQRGPSTTLLRVVCEMGAFS